MRTLIVAIVLAGGLVLAQPGVSQAQEPESGLLQVGAMAPDFALPGATRYGLLTEEVRLSDFAGETVVLAFFFRVRTRG